MGSSGNDTHSSFLHSQAMNVLLLFVSFLISSTFGELISAEWNEWTETPRAPCSDTCGYCGVRLTHVRTCKEPMKCSGIAQKYEECAPKMCPFPRKTCCAGYIKGVLGSEFECVAAGSILPTKTSLS
ncbi:hypothetical protein PRIPAC_80551 [Pristionchus pacificus]|uniref:Uncharacterized protein n=1 Tax=Pristionchus pacificus TaxID=54126 RepID=A0A2A6CNF5_PRIPA|nr:hypothetical protein PRIPAC_80551 [Pristionchus pacificus]|eukprot:PDM79617.1 hypothetical protein PRIPAC_32196 [Pristionchus pacificus]